MPTHGREMGRVADVGDGEAESLDDVGDGVVLASRDDDRAVDEAAAQVAATRSVSRSVSTTTHTIW